MKAKTQKFYCYVDETGQDTEGELFLVSVVLKDKEQLDALRQKLSKIEKSTNKKFLKWFKTPFVVKEKYLFELTKIKELREAVYYSFYKEGGKEYTPLISLTVAKSIIFQKVKDYEATITIDGLNAAETDKVRRELKRLGVHYRKIRGMKDEQEILLRLADSMAGVLRDCVEGREYAKKLLSIFLKEKIVIEL